MKRALNFYAVASAFVLAFVVLLSAGFVLYQVQRYIERDTHDATRAIAIGKAQAVNQLIRFYEGIGERLVQDPEVSDILLFGGAKRAELWSVDLRRRLPDIVGVALFTEDGTILGEAVNQRIGSKCLLDIKADARGISPPGPRVHKEVPALAHFDVSVRIARDGDNIGIVFISVSLARLRAVLAENSSANEALALLDHEGELIVRTGDTTRSGPFEQVRVKVPGSDWTLQFQAPRPPMRQVYWSFGLLTALTMAVIGGAIVLLISMATRRLRHDLTGIQTALVSLADGRPGSLGDVHLHEVEQMRPVFDRIANAIHARQQFLADLSLTDPLTELPNRRYLEAQWPHYHGLAQRGHLVTIGLVDVDYFKRINDQFGHDIGDAVLQRLAEALRLSIRSADLLARLGGDEFVIMQVDMGPASLDDWYRRLIETLRARNELPVPSKQLSLSAGFAVVDPAADAELQAALKRSDEALYDAKARGRGCLVVQDWDDGLPGTRSRETE